MTDFSLGPAPEINKENLHRNHRRRVKERYLSQGLEAFSPHELLEMILFYAVPQKDTNELGHRLLARFGTLERVFAASIEELCAVPGMGEHAALLLHLWLPAAGYIQGDEALKDAPCYDTVASLGAFFVEHFGGTKQEGVSLMLLDNAFHLIDCLRLQVGSINSAATTTRDLVEPAFRRGAAMVVVAHNHPLGIAVPSSEDISTTMMLDSAFTSVGITMIEHILVAGDQYTPIMLRCQSVKEHQASIPKTLTFAANHQLRKEEGKW